MSAKPTKQPAAPAETPETPVIVWRDPKPLTHAPEADLLPMLDDNDPSMIALRISMEARGLTTEAIIITEDGEILNGRHRRRNAVLLDWDLVPCIIRPKSEALAIASSTLAGRRHLTKGARAYVMCPFLRPLIEEARAAATARLRKGNTPSTTQSAPGGTVAEIAFKLGLSVDILNQAEKVHRIFADERTDYGLTDADRSRKDLTPREYWEPELLSGEMGLGAIIQAYQGLAAAASPGHAAKLDKRAEYDRLLLDVAGKTAQHWQRATPEQLAALAKQLPAHYAAYPPHALDLMEKAIKTARKNREEAANA